ncbi:uncharacterized protein JCM6883_006549 [Sporobolomyces salmoneus]|uniref:uncharacterized protein n=1 Tax=Sporobolomyces salmoneus TaxID=183962 RepID=UPI00317112E8
MLKIATRTTVRSLTARRAFVRAESTSAPATKAAQKPSSTKSSSSSETPQATLKSTAAPQVESPSPEKKIKVRSPTDPAADYQKRLEDRFGGGEAAALGQLVDGKPQGLAKHVKNNLFRLI